MRKTATTTQQTHTAQPKRSKPPGQQAASTATTAQPPVGQWQQLKFEFLCQLGECAVN